MKRLLGRAVLGLVFAVGAICAQSSFYWIADKIDGRIDTGKKGADATTPILSSELSHTKVPEGSNPWAVIDHFSAVPVHTSGAVFDLTLDVSPGESHDHWSRGGFIASTDAGFSAAEDIWVLAVTPNNGIVFDIVNQKSDTAGEITKFETSGEITLPVTLRIKSDGNLLEAFHRSSFSGDWTLLAADSLPLGATDIRVSHMLFEPAAHRAVSSPPTDTAKQKKEKWAVPGAFTRVPVQTSGSSFDFTLDVKPIERATDWCRGGFVISTEKVPLSSSQVWMLTATANSGIIFDEATGDDVKTKLKKSKQLSLPVSLRVKSDGSELTASYRALGASNWSKLAKAALPAGTSDIYVSHMLYSPKNHKTSSLPFIDKTKFKE